MGAPSESHPQGKARDRCGLPRAAAHTPHHALPSAVGGRYGEGSTKRFTHPAQPLDLLPHHLNFSSFPLRTSLLCVSALISPAFEARVNLFLPSSLFDPAPAETCILPTTTPSPTANCLHSGLATAETSHDN